MSRLKIYSAQKMAKNEPIRLANRLMEFTDVYVIVCSLLIVVLLLKGWRMEAVAGFEGCVRAATTSVQPHMGRYLYHS